MAVKKTAKKVVETPETTTAEKIIERVKFDSNKKWKMTATYCGQFSIGIFKENCVYNLTEEQYKILKDFCVEVK